MSEPHAHINGKAKISGNGADHEADWRFRYGEQGDEGYSYHEEEDPQPTERKYKRTLRTLTADDLDTLSDRDYLVKGWMSPSEISLIVGAKNTRKTFVALHVGYAVAQNRSVFGKRVKQTNVLYIVSEGERGIAKRVKALRSKYGRANNFYVIAQPIDLLHCTASSGHLREIIEICKERDIGLVFVDTVSRALSGGDENSPMDMGKLLANLNTLRHETDAHICGIHHGTKADGINSRGHSILPNAVDAILTIEFNEETHTGNPVLGFCRDDTTGPFPPFRTEVIKMGVDQDGDEVSTLMVEELDTGTSSPKPPKDLGKTPDIQDHMLTIFRNLVAEAGSPIQPKPDMPMVTGTTRETLRRRLIADGWYDDGQISGGKPVKAALTKENNTLRGLKRRTYLAYDHDHVWLT